jgi:glutathione synthase/RimK-type ligase-like ATP-grasp enzyme
MKTLQSQADIHDFFRRNHTPLYYVSTSTFNLLGADEWVSNLRFINTINSFAGRHPNVFVPADALTHGLQGIEAANNYLLNHPGVADRLRRSGSGGGVLFLMFGAYTEALARNLGLTVAFPPAKLRQHLDNKVTTTHLANRAGIPSVPNVLARVDTYAALRRVAHALGPDLVVQLPYGDSGTTTFFISSAADFHAYADQIAAQPAVKITQRIRCRQATLEGCVTRYGTLVGPLMTEMIGFAELTPYAGGWCGNEVFGAGASATFSPDIRRQAQQIAIAMGDQLRQEGYWGVFGLDFLIDQDTGALYLGELNPRITGVTPLTSQAALDQNDIPLLLFHLLEWFGVEYALDVEQFNRRWVDAEQTTSWSQLIIEHTTDAAETVTQVPATGIWRLEPDGTLQFSRPVFQPQAVAGDTEAFFLRTVDPGHTLERGQSIGRLLTRGRLMTDDYRLTERAKAWICGFRAHFAAPNAPHDALSASANTK